MIFFKSLRCGENVWKKCIEGDAMHETYYGMLKNGDLRQYEKPPKRKHVTMKTYTKKPGATAHMLDCAGNLRTFIAHCGYDRGPKLDRIIRKMLS